MIKGSVTTQYFKLERDEHQGNPAGDICIFILALEILFIFIKNNEKAEGITIFENSFLCTVYAGNKTLFSFLFEIYSSFASLILTK